MFNSFNVMAINSCCILGGPYYPTSLYMYSHLHMIILSQKAPQLQICMKMKLCNIDINISITGNPTGYML